VHTAFEVVVVVVQERLYFATPLGWAYTPVLSAACFRLVLEVTDPILRHVLIGLPGR
jgi:hypothetical protein